MDKKWKWGRSKIEFYYVPISVVRLAAHVS